LDEAIRRRLEKRIYIPLPTEIGRREMLRINLKEVQLEASVDLEEVVKKSDGYSGADIALLCREAAYMPMRRKLKREGGLGKKLNNLEWMKEFEKDVTVPLTMEDFS
jgi:katanin p60 ATPase-containing subunit A1